MSPSQPTRSPSAVGLPAVVQSSSSVSTPSQNKDSWQVPSSARVAEVVSQARSQSRMPLSPSVVMQVVPASSQSPASAVMASHCRDSSQVPSASRSSPPATMSPSQPTRSPSAVGLPGVVQSSSSEDSSSQNKESSQVPSSDSVSEFTSHSKLQSRRPVSPSRLQVVPRVPQSSDSPGMASHASATSQVLSPTRATPSA